MTTVGQFDIGSRIDFSQFDRDLQTLQTKMRAAAAQNITITPNINLSQFQQNLQQVVQQARQGAQQAGQAATITPNLNAQQVAQGFQQITAQAQQAAAAAGRITVRANFTEINTGFTQLAQAARALGETRFNLRIDVSDVNKAGPAVARLASELRNAKAGEVINLDVRAATVVQANQTVRELEASIKAATAAGARVNVNVQTNAPQQSFFQQARAGFIQQATPGLVSGFGAAAGVLAAQGIQQLTQALKESFDQGIEYNAMLETASAQFKVFTGSAGAAAESLSRLRQYADITPFNTQEVIRSGQVFAQVSNGEIARMERLVQLAGQLATINPNREQGGGLEGATIAIREALGGDFTSAQRRFNISRADIQSIKDAHLAGIDLAEALVKAAGGSDELVQAMGTTFEGRLSTAKANVDNLRAAATEPIFQQMSKDLAEFNAIAANAPGRLEAIARGIGLVVASQGIGGNIIALANPAQTIGAGLAAGAIARPQPPPAPVLTEAEQAQQQRAGVANAAVDAANVKLADQKKHLEDIKEALAAQKLLAAQITEEYDKQLRPLESQQRALQGQIDANAAQGRTIAARARAAQGPVEVRAQVAEADVALSHEQDLLQIRHRRAELAEQIGQAERSIAEKTAEIQIRAQEEALRAATDAAERQKQVRQDALDDLREQVRSQQEARQDALDGAREEARTRAEARQTAIDGLREQITAQQEQRRDALEGIQDEIRARRAQYDDAREVSQEQTRNAQEQFQDSEREEDRAHTARMEHLRDQIDAIQEQTRARHEQTDAERELEAFDKQQTERSRQERLQDARRAIATATTGGARRTAIQSFQRTVQDIAADRQREALQDRIKQEREAEDKKREAAQDKINALQKKARDEDREYQKEKQDREDQFREEDRGQRDQDREDEKAERERRRGEDEKVREQQRKDHDQDKKDQAELREAEQKARDLDKKDQADIREQERADRAADRKDQAEIRAQERADREADRAAQATLTEQQRGIQTARDTLATGKDAAAVIDAQNALDRLKESADLEERILGNREKGLLAVDVAAAALAAGDKIRNEDIGHALDDQAGKLDDQVKAINRRKTAEKEAFDARTAQLEIEEGKSKSILKDYQDAAENAEKAARTIGSGINPETGGFFTGNYGPVSPDTGTTFTEGPATTGSMGGWDAFWKSITDGLSNWLKADTSTSDAFSTWAGEHLAALAAVWDTGSPSKVTFQLGVDIGNGLITGIGSKQEDISAAFSAMFQVAWDAASALVDSVIGEIVGRFAGQESYSLPSRLSGEASPAIATAISDAFDQAWAQGGAGGVDSILDEITTRFGGQESYSLPPKIEGSSSALATAISDAFDAAWATGGADGVDVVIGEIGNRFGGSDSFSLPSILDAMGPTLGQAIAESFNQAWAQGGAAGVDAVLAEIGARWAAIGDQIDSNSNETAIQNAITNLFGPNVLDRAFRQVERNFEIYGGNIAVSFINGWTDMMSSWEPYIPAPSSGMGGGGGGGIATTNYGGGGGGQTTNYNGQTTSMGYPILPGSQDITNYLVQKGYTQGTQEFHDAFESLVSQMYDDGRPPPPDMTVTGRRAGGSYDQNRMYLLHKDEIMVPQTAGEVLPPEFLQGVKAMAARGTMAPAAASNGPVNVNINFADGSVSIGGANADDIDFNHPAFIAYGRTIVEQTVAVMRAAKRNVPSRVSPYLGGAR